MAMFVVDRTFPGMTEELLAEVHRLLQEAARRVSSSGEGVRHLRCLYIPEDDRCICLFEARDLAAVRAVNEIAQAPFRWIGSAIEFRAPGVRHTADEVSGESGKEKP